MIKKIKNNQKGTSFIELILAVAIFSMASLIATNMFQNVTEGQKAAVASQNTQESLRFSYEMMAKEIRTAQGAHTGINCNQPIMRFKVFNTSESVSDNTGDELFYQNKNGECVRLYLENDSGVDRLKKWQDFDKDNNVDNGETGFITPDEVMVNNLLFQVVDDRVDAFHSTQPRVTINMDLQMNTPQTIHQQDIKIQTTISSRYYE